MNSSFLSESAPSFDKDLQTPVRESSITNSVVLNIVAPSDNPTFKENTSQINTCKLKPDSSDTLPLSKLTSLRLNLMLSKVLLLVKYLI